MHAKSTAGGSYRTYIIFGDMRNCMLPIQHVPLLHITSESKGTTTTGPLQSGTGQRCHKSYHKDSWRQRLTAPGTPTPDLFSNVTPEAVSTVGRDRKAPRFEIRIFMLSGELPSQADGLYIFTRQASAGKWRLRPIILSPNCRRKKKKQHPINTERI